MKKFIPAMVAGLMLMVGSPASAQTGQDYDMKFDLTYTPLRVSTSSPSGVINSSLSAITLQGEGRVFQGLMFGGAYSRGTGNSLTITGVTGGGATLNNVTFSDPEYADLKIYMKVPFNWQAFADSDRTVGPRPAYSPFYAYFGYKNTTLSATAPSTAPTIGRLNVESASGGGLGIGADVKFDPISVYGQFVYYPTLFTKNIGASTTSTDGFLRVYEYDLGLRAKFGDSPFSAKIGYHRETHNAQNVDLVYDGVQFGASAEF